MGNIVTLTNKLFQGLGVSKVIHTMTLVTPRPRIQTGLKNLKQGVTGTFIFLEKKFVKHGKGDDITPFDGIFLRFANIIQDNFNER